MVINLNKFYKMKCLFPKLTSMQQKFVCVGAGVLFSASTVGGLYYSHKFIDYYKAADVTMNYVENKICYGLDTYEKKFCDKKPLMSEETSNNLDKYLTKPILKPIFDYAIIPASKYVGIPVLSFIGIFHPILAFGYLYDDLKKFRNMMKNTDQCCTIIRMAGAKTIIYPVILGSSFGISLVSCLIFRDCVVRPVKNYWRNDD